MLRHDEVVAVALLVAEKEVLAVRRVDVVPAQQRFFDGEDGR